MIAQAYTLANANSTPFTIGSNRDNDGLVVLVYAGGYVKIRLCLFNALSFQTNLKGTASYFNGRFDQENAQHVSSSSMSPFYF
jgi:hypothetical protein